MGHMQFKKNQNLYIIKTSVLKKKKGKYNLSFA